MMLTVTEAAQLLGQSPRTVRARLARGDLPGRKRGGRWIVPRDVLPLSEAEHRRIQAQADVLVGVGAGMRHLRSHGDWAADYTGDVPIVFGHHPVGRTPQWMGARALGLDTGVDHGGALSAVVIPGFRTYSVRAVRNYALHARPSWRDPWRRRG